MKNEQLSNLQQSSETNGRFRPLVIIFVLLVAAFFRFYALPNLPPGLNFDEAGNGVAALDILSGNPKIWWQIGGGKEPLWPYVVAVTTTVLGFLPLAVRLPAALVGILTVAAVYPLAGALFKNHNSGRLIALFSMLGLAVSDWHLHFSRLGFRAILLPLLSTLAFCFFWRMFRAALRPDNPKQSFRAAFRNLNTILAALFLALGIYAYLAARILPLVIIIFLALAWLIVFLTKRRSGSPNPVSLRVPFFALAALFAGLILFLSPLIIHFIFNPADLLARTTTVSIFNPEWNNGDLPGTARRAVSLTLGTYLGLPGDLNPLVNLPAQPALSSLFAVFFLLGLAISLYQTIRPIFTPNSPNSLNPPLSPHLFLLCWWTVMLLPAILAPDGAPHHLRLIGTLVPTYIILAVGMVAATNFTGSLIPRSTRLALLLPAACYLLLAIQTCTNYFVRWPQSADFTLPFDLYATRLAADISTAGPHAAYVLPMDIRAAEEARHYTLDYLLAPHQPAPYTYIPVDERNAETLLSQAASGKTELRVIRWTEDKHREADAKEIVTYLLQSHATLAGQQSFPVYNVETYLLPENDKTSFTLPAIAQPIGANFDELLRLDAAFVPPETAAGEALAVAFTVAPLGPIDADYKASVRLVDDSGRRVLQKDRVLQHNFHQGTSLWPPETVNEYYLLPVPPETLPGKYTVTLLIYHPETLNPLVAKGLVEVPLGTVHVIAGE